MKYAGWLMVALLGVVNAPAALAVSIDVGSASGAPGQTVTFKVTLNAMGQKVGGDKNTITVEAETPLVDCTLNPDLHAAGGAALFPDECTPGTDCSSVNVAVIGTSRNGFRDKSTLYTCQVTIAADAQSGTYPLTISNIDVSTPEPVHIPDATGTDGFIEVVLPTATPTVTQTPLTPVPTPTATPTPFLPPEDDDACQVVAPGQSHAAWPLLLPVAVLWAFRRRRDR